MNITVNEWLQAAHHEVELRQWREASHGKIKSVAVEHVFPEASPEELMWYMVNFDEESYKLWHPAHIGLQWEKKVAGPGAIHIAWENILGKVAAYRIRLDGPEQSPVAPDEAAIALMTNIIDTQGEVLIYILNELKVTEAGVLMTCTFVFPEATPDEFVGAHRRHNVEEVQGMVEKAVPYLIRKTFGYAAEADVLAKYHDVLI